MRRAPARLAPVMRAHLAKLEFLLTVETMARVSGAGNMAQVNGRTSCIGDAGTPCERFRVHGLGFRVQGSGFRVQGPGFRVYGSWFRVSGFGF